MRRCSVCKKNVAATYLDDDELGVYFCRPCWDEKRRQRPLPDPPDDGPVEEILAYSRACAAAWEPEARIQGNLRAGDLVRALDVAIGYFDDPASVCEGCRENPNAELETAENLVGTVDVDQVLADMIEAGIVEPEPSVVESGPVEPAKLPKTLPPGVVDRPPDELGGFIVDDRTEAEPWRCPRCKRDLMIRPIDRSETPMCARCLDDDGVDSLLERVGVARPKVMRPPGWFGFARFVVAQQEWSIKTFGAGRRTVGICKHIRKELAEIEAAPIDLSEWVDVVILALDGAWRAAGFSAGEIIDGLIAKQTKNFARDWPEPGPEDEPVEHIKPADYVHPPDFKSDDDLAEQLMARVVELEAERQEAVTRRMAADKRVAELEADRDNEKASRIRYQDTAYKLCNLLDRRGVPFLAVCELPAAVERLKAEWLAAVKRLADMEAEPATLPKTLPPGCADRPTAGFELNQAEPWRCSRCGRGVMIRPADRSETPCCARCLDDDGIIDARLVRVGDSTP